VNEQNGGTLGDKPKVHDAQQLHNSNIHTQYSPIRTVIVHLLRSVRHNIHLITGKTFQASSSLGFGVLWTLQSRRRMNTGFILGCIWILLGQKQILKNVDV
jgi:hypothetical protein